MKKRKTQGYATTTDEPSGKTAEAHETAAPGEAVAPHATNGANGAEAASAASPAEAPAAAPAQPEAPAAPAPVAAEPGGDDQLAALRAERDDMRDRMLRIAADFENWKKRARKAETDAATEARERVLKDMLEVVDNLERAVGMQPGGNGGDGGAVLKGVDLVLRLLKQKLERHEVKAFDALGQPFDPRVHEAISKVASADIPAGAVAVELQKGYRVGERLLRPALVSVSTGPA
jgi:molecular chaperone GrpE